MKKRYLCPVCEHELTAKSFCPECRRIRREPLIYAGGALPNESENRASDVFQNTRYPDTCGQKHTYGIPNKDPHKKTASVNGKSQKSTAGGKVFVRLVVILVLIFVIVLCWEPIKDAALELWEATGISEMFGGSSKTENTDENSVSYASEVDDEKIMEAGQPCNGYAHYDVDGQVFVDTVAGYCEDVWTGKEVEVSEGNISNRVSEYGAEAYTYYENTVYIDIYDIGAYLSVVSDSVTGEVMTVSASAETKDDIMKLLLLIGCGLEPEADRNQIWSEVQENFAMVEDGYLFEDWRMSELYISGEDGDYYVSLECLDAYDKY